MSKPLPHRELERLVFASPACSGSAQEGERANAAAAADKLVRERGLTWEQILTPAPASRIAAPVGTAAKLALLRQHLDELTDWEVGFVTSLRHFRKFSPKQLAVVDRLVAEVTQHNGDL
jgi:hypothetical protein